MYTFVIFSMDLHTILLHNYLRVEKLPTADSQKGDS